MPALKTLIRPYTNSDTEILLHIFKLNVPLYFASNEVNEFDDYLQRFGNTYFTIEYNSIIVGGVGYRIESEDNSGRITWIFLHPHYMSLGLGKQAVEHCLHILKKHRDLEKLVITTSQLAYRFFEKFGYKLIYTEKEYWGPGLDFYFMEKAVESE